MKMVQEIQAGGQEPAMHDGRNAPGFNIHYSLEPTPGRHTIDANLCIGCGFCSRECPVEAIIMQKPVKTQKATAETFAASPGDPA